MIKNNKRKVKKNLQKNRQKRKVEKNKKRMNKILKVKRKWKKYNNQKVLFQPNLWTSNSNKHF